MRGVRARERGYSMLHVVELDLQGSVALGGGLPPMASNSAFQHITGMLSVNTNSRRCPAGEVFVVV